MRRVGLREARLLQFRRVGADARGDGVGVLWLVALRHRLHRLVEERNLRWESIAEEAGDAERHVDARTLQLRRAG